MGCQKSIDLQSNQVVNKMNAKVESNSQVTFYTICNAAYFPGLVGPIDSLRLLGHHNSIVVLDCGLTSKQRDILSSHYSIVVIENVKI